MSWFVEVLVMSLGSQELFMSECTCGLCRLWWCHKGLSRWSGRSSCWVVELLVMSVVAQEVVEVGMETWFVQVVFISEGAW